DPTGLPLSAFHASSCQLTVLTYLISCDVTDSCDVMEYSSQVTGRRIDPHPTDCIVGWLDHQPNYRLYAWVL
ncbi:unnamed protein product, partial [Mycena citricolor]